MEQGIFEQLYRCWTTRENKKENGKSEQGESKAGPPRPTIEWDLHIQNLVAEVLFVGAGKCVPHCVS